MATTTPNNPDKRATPPGVGGAFGAIGRWFRGRRGPSVDLIPAGLSRRAKVGGVQAKHPTGVKKVVQRLR